MTDSSNEVEENDEKKNERSGGKKRNLVIICLAFLCIFISYNAVSNLQSSVNVDEEVGLNSLALFSAGAMFACLFLVTPIIFLFGYKWSIVSGQVAILAFVVANMYPHPALLYPISGIGGIFFATMWTAQNAYITLLGTDENRDDDDDNDDAKVNKYFGIFFCVYQTAEIWGNLVTYFILRNMDQSSKNDTTKCGANFLPSEQSTTDGGGSLPPTTTYILFGVFAAVILVSIVLVIVFLDQKRKLKGDDDSKDLLHISLDYTMSTLKQLIKPKFILFLPLIFWSNASPTFVYSAFTSSFISCTMNIAQIGLAMTGYGIAASICSVIIGYLAKLKYGRPACILLASVLCYVAFVIMLVWPPNAGQAYVVYILACVFGLINAVFVTFAPALFGTTFVDSKETSFSVFQFADNAGVLVVLMCSAALRVRISIILQIVYLTLALICYVIIEIRHPKTPEEENSNVAVLNNLVVIETNEIALEKF